MDSRLRGNDKTAPDRRGTNLRFESSDFRDERRNDEPLSRLRG